MNEWSMNEWVNGWINESINVQWKNEWINDINEWKMNEWKLKSLEMGENENGLWCHERSTRMNRWKDE